MGNILILGGGFGGLIVAERLAAAVGHSNQITLVSPSRKFTFYPALVQLAFDECDESEITFDLREKLGRIGVRFIQGEVLRIDKTDRKVQITGNDISGEINFDHLVIATGRHLATDTVEGFFEHAHHLLGTKAARRFGRAVENFSSGRIVVGLCPDSRLPVPVCETAFALAKRFADKIASGDVHVTVIFPGSLSDAFGGAQLHEQLETAFAKHGINVLYDVPITDIREGEFFSSRKHRIEYDLLMLIPSFRGQAMFRGAGITDGNDFVMVNDLMQVHGLEHAYAVGDIVAFSGPKFAHMAVRQAEVAARNLIAEINGESPTEHYYHEIATIVDAGGPDSIYLHYGIWDDSMYRLKQGRLWGWAKEAHDTWWQARNR